jgi:hypothetical protein
MSAGKERTVVLGPGDLWLPWNTCEEREEVPTLPTGNQGQISQEKNGCSHEWVEIELFRFTAFYCHKCGIKREELNEQP